MAYKIKLNDKVFESIDADNISITLQLDDDKDVIFFYEWQLESSSDVFKMDFIRDIDFVKITENGTLFNCYPILNDNETQVKIFYDYKKSDMSQIKN